MSNNVESPSLLARIVAHDATRRGLAGALSGVLVALIIETVPWPKA